MTIQNTRFKILPGEITNHIFELAIKSHFSEKIANEIWYNTWKLWRKNICAKVDYKNRDRLDFYINFLFNSRGIYKSCFHNLYNMPLTSLWDKYAKIYPDDFTIYLHIRNTGEMIIDLCENKSYVFRYIVFTYEEYYNYFINNDNANNIIDVDENDIYKLCYLGIWFYTDIYSMNTTSQIGIHTIHEFDV